MLEVIAGMVFTYLLLSLLGTTINELLSAWRGWRGLYLEEGLKRMLEFADDPKVFNEFDRNALFQQLKQHKLILRVSRAPTWLSAHNFSSILLTLLKKGRQGVDEAQELVKELPENSKLRQVFEQFIAEGNEKLTDFRARLESWFDDVMEQASGWYKRHMQMVTFVVGLAIAAGLNADSFQMYHTMTTNAAARERLNLLAEQFVAAHTSVPSSGISGDSLSLAEMRAQVEEFLASEHFSTTSNLLGLGWSVQDLYASPAEWLKRMGGWLLTALAISLGAPFWFDILKKIINIRSGGGNTTPTVVIQQPAPPK